MKPKPDEKDGLKFMPSLKPPPPEDLCVDAARTGAPPPGGGPPTMNLKCVLVLNVYKVKDRTSFLFNYIRKKGP